jgi:trans-2,3-dihydro-3-hydroxyanthranilate isomerase
MTDYRFRLLNVFAASTLGGNPLAVFEDASRLDDQTMQALALQFNLSETTFVFPSTTASARVKIFTPTFEMRFAGHPTLGTAHVVREAKATGDSLTLEMLAGIIPVSANGDEWTLRANAPRTNAVKANRRDIASAIGLDEADIAGDPLWVDTGSEQLVIPLANVAAVDRCRPDGRLMEQHCHNGQRAMVYVWARDGQPRMNVQHATVRFFFLKDGAPVEDPGTGSACANLGGYLLGQSEPLPLNWQLSQGTHINKPCELKLHVDGDKNIHVGGRVIALGHGTISLPS